MQGASTTSGSPSPTSELIEEWNLDFSGIKGQPELTTHFATMDITEAFLNDPYDWDGPKETHVCATEADMDAALTMQLLKGLSGTPVLFADVRHYHAERDLWDLCNSGQHATWFASRSDDPAENMRHVHLYPEEFFFPAGGAAVHHLAAEGDFTFARLTRLNGRYRMHVLRGSFVRYDGETNEDLMRRSTYVWPHAFARMDASADEILSRYGSNHIHAIPGNHVEELRTVCKLSQWADPADSEENVRWTRELFEAMQPFLEKGVYVNNLGEEEGDRVKEAYGEHYSRLVALKDKYDPTNLFRLNQNVKPATHTSAAS